MRLTFGKCLLLTPAFCCGSSHFEHLVQNETFSLLKEVGLVKDVTPSDEPSTPVVAPEVALGGHSAEKTVTSSLNSIDKQITFIDCWAHRMAKQLSILEAERKRQMNSLTKILNSILEHYQQLQAHLMASGTLLIGSFEEQPDVQTSLQKLREKVALFMDLCAETFTPFPHTYSEKDLIPQPIHGFISHVHQCPDEIKCDHCGGEHETDLCAHIYNLQLGDRNVEVTLLEDQDSIDLAPLGYTTYVCSCGQTHAYTYECPEKKPVMLTQTYDLEAGIATLSLDKSLPEGVRTREVNLEPEPVIQNSIPGYIAPDKTWHRLNTVWREPVSGESPYLCKCGKWHSKALSCAYRYDGNGFFHYPVYKNKTPGYICTCGDWHVQGHRCPNPENFRYLCTCGKDHDLSGFCHENNGAPYPLYQNGIAGYNCSIDVHWHPLNTICQLGLTNPPHNGQALGYLCACGQMHTSAEQCEESYPLMA